MKETKEVQSLGTPIPVIKSKKEAPKKPARRYPLPKEALPVLFALHDYCEDCEKRGGVSQAKNAFWRFIHLMIPKMGNDVKVAWVINMKDANDGVVYVEESSADTPKVPDFMRGLLGKR